ncbi:DNA repair protein Rad60 [Anopheles ziemanni]|nr:DNA repair protein Rad60 [Anopheles ziemanni]
MRIKIKWVNRIEMFTLRKHQKFGDLIEKLATKEKADTKSILLNLNDRIIYADDTPDSIGYKTFQFISGRVLRDNAPIMTKTAASSNVNSISLKVQLANRKAPLRLQMDKNQTMIVLVIKCAEELKCKPEDIKLYFDGDLVDNGSKPEDLELEGDELLDIRLVR